jgi:hypothetical protein
VLNTVLSDVYYVSFPNDRIILKIAVAWVYLAGVTQTGLVVLDLNAMFLEMLASASQAALPIVPDHFWLSITALTGAGAG